MGIVTQYYFDAFLRKVEESDRKLEEFWSGSRVRDLVETCQKFQYQRGEWVEDKEEDQMYEVVGRMQIYSVIRDQEVYRVDHLNRIAEGEELRKSYDEKTINGEELR